MGLFALVGSGLSRTVEAQVRRSVLVLRLEHSGVIAGRVPSLEKAMRAGIRRAVPRYRLLPAPKIELSALQRAAGCVQDGRACLVRIGRTLNATQVVRVRLDGAPTEVQLEVQGVWTRSGRAIRYEASLGPLDDQSPAELRWHLERAFGRTPPAPVGRIELVSEGAAGILDGVEVRLDDEIIPVGELAAVVAGKRRLEVRQRGFAPFVWEGQVRPGRANRVAVRWGRRAVGAPVNARDIVAPTAVTGTNAGDEGPRFVATWVLGSAAVVAASASIVLGLTVLKREKDAEAQGLDCGGKDSRTGTCSAGRRQAALTTVGWAMTAGLAAATATALLLEWRSSDPVHLGLAPTNGGASFALRLALP